MNFEFNFRTTALSSGSRQQLTNIARAIKPSSTAAGSRSALLSLIEAHAFDREKGLYVPVSDDVRLTGKLPFYSEKLGPTEFPNGPFPYCYFTNPLLIPIGYGAESFDKKTALEPKCRATNAGFLVVTIEYDCRSTNELEECLRWTRGKDGDFKQSSFASADRELARFRDYLGYTVVFTGNRSLHFHLIFSTKHLTNAPWDLCADERLDQSHSDLMREVHRLYWDTAAKVFESVLQPSLAPDDKLRSLTQWRRSPWALRRLDEPSTVLNLPEGPIIPQLVINEFVRTRAPRNAQQFLVPADYRAKQSQSRSRGRGQFIAKQVDDKDLLGSLRQRCHEEWGTEFPKPASVRCDRGEWRIKFFNHADDKKPSTFVKGPYRRLVPNGAHAFTQNFYLPDHMSTDELCEDLSDKLTARSDLDLRFRPKARLKRLIRQGKRGFVSSCLDVLESRFAQPVGDEAAKNIIFTLRQRLWPAINQARVFSADMLIRSPEGIGKTSTLFNEVASEIFDAALSNDRRFGCFAYRSNEQAEFKAQEYRASKDYRQAVVLVSFWEQYRRCCDQEGVNQIPKHEFPDHSLNGILRQIKLQQPSVFDSLEARRRGLWIGSSGKSLFDPAMTVLFTSHDLAQNWHRSHITRLWHNPSFEPFADHNDDALKAELTMSQIVVDEPETDNLLHILPESVIEALERIKRRYARWREKPRNERYSAYLTEKASKEIPGSYSFEEFDELMRVALDELELWEVDYAAIPFGHDQPGKGIYSAKDGRRFYLGVQDWLMSCNTRLTFLTTEALVARVLAQLYEAKLGKRLIALDLYARCKLFPIEIPLVIDRRAAADRHEKTKVSALAAEILRDHPNAILIANGSDRSDPRIKTFQAAKGLNGLEDNDVFIIPTWLSPEQYAELNLIAQWLEIPSAVTLFYEDQISQAVGRNTGFRKSEKSTKTKVVCSNRLAKRVLAECFQDNFARIRLVRDSRR